MAATPIVTTTLDVRRLPGLRRQLGMTQEELAGRVGTTAQEVSRLESALRPEGLLDRLVGGLTTAAGEADRPK